MEEGCSKKEDDEDHCANFGRVVVVELEAAICGLSVGSARVSGHAYIHDAELGRCRFSKHTKLRSGTECRTFCEDKVAERA